jgi:hypothetical protein
MDPEDADYVCTFDEYTLEKAIRELNENPKERLGSVQALRRWIKEQPHYTCRTDTQFLLLVLRKAKFSQLVARELIDNILTMRTQCPEFMVNIDLQDPGILAFIERGILVPLPKPDKEGRSIWLSRPGIMDLKDPLLNPVNEMRAAMALSEYIRDNDDKTLVHGVVIVNDGTNVSMKYMTRTSMDFNKKSMKVYQDCNPERIKAFIMYNCGTILEMALALFKPLMKKKLQERVTTTVV